MAKDKRILNVVQWFKRISLCLNWASDCVSRFPDFEAHEEQPTADNIEDITEQQV